MGSGWIRSFPVVLVFFMFIILILDSTRFSGDEDLRFSELFALGYWIYISSVVSIHYMSRVINSVDASVFLREVYVDHRLIRWCLPTGTEPVVGTCRFKIFVIFLCVENMDCFGASLDHHQTSQCLLGYFWIWIFCSLCGDGRLIRWCLVVITKSVGAVYTKKDLAAGTTNCFGEASTDCFGAVLIASPNQSVLPGFRRACSRHNACTDDVHGNQLKKQFSGWMGELWGRKHFL